MRGTPLGGRESRSDRGIIPADAGNTWIADPFGRAWQDHPRGCGEHICSQSRSSHTRGSSPRMRGTLLEVPGSAIDDGIIPADAGSTRCGCTRLWCLADHPRGCGEHQVVASPNHQLTGSSPRMRGAPPGAFPRLPCGRIIPADAGSTWASACTTARATDHPRGCGEHGSSPWPWSWP